MYLLNGWQIHQQALETLVDCLTTPPILAYLDYEKDFILHVDANEKGLSAVLYQEQEKVLQVIEYGSRTLSPAERTTTSIQGSLMALKWQSQNSSEIAYIMHLTFMCIWITNL